MGPNTLLLVGRGASAAASAAGGLFAWGAVSPSAQLFCPAICRTGDDGCIALTFDDGPNPGVTPYLLDLLEQHHARATFFLIGRRVEQFPSLAREIAERGHTIGNHTYEHPGLTFLSPKRIADELNRCDSAIRDAVGIWPRWMRPPYGLRGPQLHRVIQRRPKIEVAMWSRWAWDWKPQPAASVIRALGRVRGGDIILMHDGDHRLAVGDRAHVVSGLAHWLPRWRDAGLRFVKLDQLDV